MDPISVYIPCYNVERFIGQCIEHLLKQSLPPSEILIVNDGSTDKTVEIACKYPVNIIHHNGNQGLGAARNTGIQNARNEWVASIDADCLASVNWLEMLFKEMSDSKVAGIGGKLIEKFQEKATDRWRAVHMRQHWWNERKINPMFLFGHSNMFRKSVIQEIGGYNPKYRTNFEDVDISHRIMEKGYQLVYTPDAIVYHLRQDTIYSALKAYWRWTLFDKVEPTDWNKLFVKWKFNAGKSKYFFLTDGKEGKWDLAWLDILMFPYHCCFDWKYFSGKIK